MLGPDLGPRYRIASLIGQGGMGRVYKAYDKELDRIVAIKMLRPELTAEPSARMRFKQELLLASKISHKNILRIHDLGDADGVKFISMVYVEGEDLHQLLKKHKRLPLDRALNITRQLCEALEAAHAEGVVHRDLKPQNILVDKANHVYITDFGLAKSLEVGVAGMTRTGAFLGTPRYMSPEQVEGKPVDHRSDLYALGLILYEMVTGEVPFAGDSALQVMYQRVNQDPPNPKALNPALPDYLARITLRCLEKDPARRYQRAPDILHDLEAARASVGSRSVRIALPVLSHRSWVAAGAALLFFVVLAFAVPGMRHWILRWPFGRAAMRAGPSVAQEKYLAILPFRVLGDQASLGYIADGLVEGLSSKLFQLKDVRLASTSAAGKVDAKESLAKIARKLGVTLVLQGTLQETGGKIRVIANLEDAAAGRRLWSQEFSGVSQDLLTLEDQIYNKLAAALELKPSSEELARGVMHPTENIEAYDLYLRGRTAIHGGRELKDVQTAIGFYDEALKKDPGFALAYAGLADANLQMYRLQNDSSWAEKALGAAQAGRRLNENVAEIHFALGSVYNATGKTAEATAELKHALELVPNSHEGYRRLGEIYAATGRKDEAIQAYEKAIELNPYYWLNYYVLGQAYWRFGENDKALSAFRRVVEIDPDNGTGYDNIGIVYFSMGKLEESIPAFQKALQMRAYYGTYSNLGEVYFYLKRYDEAVKMLEKAVELNPNGELSVGNLADAYRWSGQPDKARATYDRAMALALKDLQVNPRNASVMGHLAQYYAKKGNTSQALQVIHRARSIDPNNVEMISTEAVVQTLAGRLPEALQVLREAFQKGYSPKDAQNEPELSNLHTHPEFEKLVREFNRKTN